MEREKIVINNTGNRDLEIILHKGRTDLGSLKKKVLKHYVVFSKNTNTKEKIYINYENIISIEVSKCLLTIKNMEKNCMIISRSGILNVFVTEFLFIYSHTGVVFLRRDIEFGRIQIIDGILLVKKEQEYGKNKLKIDGVKSVIVRTK